MSDDEVALEHKAVDRAHARLIARLSQANGIQPQDVTRAIRDLIAASYQAGCAALAEARRGALEEAVQVILNWIADRRRRGADNWHRYDFSHFEALAAAIRALAAPDQGRWELMSESDEFAAKTAINKRVAARYDELMHEGKHGHYETMFRVVHEELAAMTRERDEMIAAYNNSAELALTYMGQRDAAMAALRRILDYKGVGLYGFRRIAKEALAALDATTVRQEKPAKKHFDVQPPGDDPQKIG